MALSIRRERRWVFAPTDPASAKGLAVAAGVSPVLAQLLLNRGISTPEAVGSFLRPDLRLLRDPDLLPGMGVAADRLRRAIAAGERIVIYGDYDVDGICAIVLLLEAITLAGGRAEYYVPDRRDEGYGLNADALRQLAAGGADVVVTVDCGVTAVEEARVARECGMDLIITDHHKPGPDLPEAFALVNPHFPYGVCPFPDLAGAGVAFKLAWALGKSLSPTQRVSAEFREFLRDAVALAGLGTIADVVPLLDENRVLASFGLEGLRRSARPGIRALCRVASLDGGGMDAWDVAFKLAPRLNAAGRLGSARRAVDLLMTDDAAEALRIAQELDRENARRQRLQQQIQDEAVAMIERSGGLDGRLGVVVASPDWHAGVVGVVAGRLAEQTARPSVVIALQGDTGRGSARSGGGGVDLFDVLTECRDALIEFGGHADAAGLCVAADRVDLFRERFEAALRARLGGKDPVPVLDVEIEARLLWLTEDLAREVERLKPFGPGNEDPVFASAGVRVAAPPQRVGVGSRHLAFWVRQDGIGRRAIAFHMADMADAVGEGDVCAIAYVPCITVMRGERQVELRVLDIKPGDMP